MDIILRVQGPTEMNSILLKDTHYEAVLEQVADAKKNSRFFEYVHHRSEERMAVDSNRIAYIIEKK